MTKRINKIIQGLQALEKSAKDIGNIEEAAAAASKIQEILLKYNLDLEDIPDSEQEYNIENDLFNMSSYIRKNEGGFAVHLISIIGANSFCKVVIQGNVSNAQNVYIFGEKHNVESTKRLFNLLVQVLRDIEKSDWPSYTGHLKRGAYRRSFLKGAMMGVHHKMVSQTEEFKSSEKGLILYDKVQEKLSSEVNNFFGKSLKPSRKTKVHRDAYRRGVEKGKKVSLGKDLSPSPNQLLK